jgi:type II secretory pathway pseudopilin PulG
MSRDSAFTIRSARTWRYTPSRAATSMIDLVICVLVMGIMAAVALPKFSSAVASLRCEAVAKRIASDLNYARRMSMQTSLETEVGFRNFPAGYDMLNVESPIRPNKQYVVNLSDIDSAVGLTSFSFDGKSKLKFNAYGRPLVNSGPLKVGQIVVSCGTFQYKAVIDPSTGEAQVQ